MPARLLAFLALVCGATTAQAGAPLAAGTRTTAPPRSVQVAPRAGPAALPAGQLHELGRRHRRGPAAMAGPVAEPLPGDGAPSLVVPAPLVAGAYTVIEDTDLRSVIPSDLTSVTSEPCTAKSGRDVFMTGNWFAAASVDGGASFGFVDPFTAFPSVNAGFCCDQSTLYDPGRDLFIWILSYIEDGVTNTTRIAVAHGQQAFENGTWSYYDFTPQDIGLPSQRWFDYPQMAVGANFLYVTVNVFQTNDGPFTNSVILRLPLDPLAAATTVSYDFLAVSDRFTLTPVQGAGTTMYWGSNDAGSSTVRLYVWPESSTQAGFTDVHVAGWSQAPPQCTAPDGRNWCGRTDDRILTGWVAGGRIGFMWDSSQQPSSRPYPYVRVVRLDETTRTLVDQPDIFSTDYALQIPAVGVNAHGHIAGTLFLGAGTRYPTLAGLILDDLSTPVPPWEIHELAASNSGPLTASWGDFVCSRPDFPDAENWAVTGWTLRDRGDGPGIHPHFLVVGRERDFTCSTQGCPDDRNSCTDDVCNAGFCTHPPRADGMSCDDGNRCTLGETCAAGACTGGTAPDCDDGDPCTLQACDPSAGCQNPPLPGFDGLLCFFERGLPTASCVSGVPNGIGHRFARAHRLAERASVAFRAKKQRRLLRRSARLLARARTVAFRAVRQERIADPCYTAVDGALGSVRDLALDVLAQL